MNRKRLNLAGIAAVLSVVGAPDGSPVPTPDARNPGSGTRPAERKPATVAKESRQLRRARARAERKRAPHREASVSAYDTRTTEDHVSTTDMKKRVVDLNCPACYDAGCTVKVHMALAPEVVPGEGDAWVSRRVTRTGCGVVLTEPIRDLVFLTADLIANRAAERGALHAAYEAGYTRGHNDTAEGCVVHSAVAADEYLDLFPAFRAA